MNNSFIDQSNILVKEELAEDYSDNELEFEDAHTSAEEAAYMQFKNQHIDNIQRRA